MRYAAKVDGPHSAIVQALRQLGCSVLDLSRVGNGCPDLLVGRGGATVLLEVKTPRGRVLASQTAFARAWQGCPVKIIRSVDEAIRLIGAKP